MNNFTYSIPTKIHFGKGQISHLSELSESGNKVLLCYGGGSIKKAGIYDEAVKILKEEDMEIFELSGIAPNFVKKTASIWYLLLEEDLSLTVQRL